MCKDNVHRQEQEETLLTRQGRMRGYNTTDLYEMMGTDYQDLGMKRGLVQWIRSTLA